MKHALILLTIILFLSGNISAQDKITDVKIKVYPESSEIRPYESAVIQIQFFGEKKKSIFDSIFSADGKEGQLQINDWKASLEADSGWLSKQFLRQEEGVKTKSGLDNFVLQGISSISAKDSVQFTAPAKTGKYTIKLSRGEIVKEVVVKVSNSANSERKSEKVNFPDREKTNDPYFSLVEHYAPFIAQETWFNPKADYLARFDYDGNWKGYDNWENLETGSSQAFVYYAVMETETHWFLIYNFFHPRDYSDFCVAGSCHENDNEGLILTVRKDRSEFGKLEVLETLAHDNIYSFTNESKIKNDVHDIDGKVEFYQNSHPIIFIEAGGHGVFGSNARDSLFSADTMEFKENTGVTYVYRGNAMRPTHSNDRNVSYALLPIYSEWWEKGSQQTDRSNDSFEEFFAYEPFGNRPRASAEFIAGAFHGSTAGKNLAKPFWGWHDNKTKKKKLLSVGQWALDPAYSVSLNLKFPRELPISLDYIFNPYLESGKKRQQRQ